MGDDQAILMIVVITGPFSKQTLILKILNCGVVDLIEGVRCQELRYVPNNKSGVLHKDDCVRLSEAHNWCAENIGAHWRSAQCCAVLEQQGA